MILTKKGLKGLVGIGLFFLSLSCSTEVSYEEKLTNEIAWSLLREVSKDYQIEECVLGGSMMDDVKMLSLSFGIIKRSTIEEARKLIVCYVEEYLNRINSNKKLIPYLHQYPFTYENVKFRISFYEKGSFEDYEENIEKPLDTVKLLDGEVLYFKWEKGRLQDLFNEPYAKALEIVQQEHVKQELEGHNQK